MTDGHEKNSRERAYRLFRLVLNGAVNRDLFAWVAPELERFVDALIDAAKKEAKEDVARALRQTSNTLIAAHLLDGLGIDGCGILPDLSDEGEPDTIADPRIDEEADRGDVGAKIEQGE